jgi:hypothetical protein
MSVAVTVGKRVLQGDDVVSLLSGHNLWPQLMEAMVVDKALRKVTCSTEEIEGYYGLQITDDAAFLSVGRCCWSALRSSSSSLRLALFS